jgi:uncharacterized protein YjbJ (UPF0337 family)
MNATITNSIASLKRHFAQAASVLLLMGVIWQSMAVGANASVSMTQNGTTNLFATSADSIAKQVSGKADQIKGAAKDSMGRAQSKMENKGGEAKRKVKNDVNETKIAVDNTAARAGNSAGNAVEAVKDFFGQ